MLFGWVPAILGLHGINWQLVQPIPPKSQTEPAAGIVPRESWHRPALNVDLHTVQHPGASPLDCNRQVIPAAPSIFQGLHYRVPNIFKCMCENDEKHVFHVVSQLWNIPTLGMIQTGDVFVWKSPGRSGPETQAGQSSCFTMKADICCIFHQMPMQENTDWSKNHPSNPQ